VIYPNLTLCVIEQTQCHNSDVRVLPRSFLRERQRAHVPLTEDAQNHRFDELLDIYESKYEHDSVKHQMSIY